MHVLQRWQMLSFNSSAVWAVALATLVFSIACESNDVGKRCGYETDPGFVASEPVSGEVPLVGVARVHRDSECETFECLTYAGLEPHCTRKCEMDPLPSKNKSCTVDKDCDGSYCFEGLCRDDDCPNGFWCRQIQDAGPLADNRYCVRRTGCSENIDCEDLGKIACKQLGCFDACCLSSRTCEFDPDTVSSGACAFHELICEPWEDLGCICSAEAATCQCQPTGGGSPWVGPVEQRGVCLPQKDN